MFSGETIKNFQSNMIPNQLHIFTDDRNVKIWQQDQECNILKSKIWTKYAICNPSSLSLSKHFMVAEEIHLSDFFVMAWKAQYYTIYTQCNKTSYPYTSLKPDGDKVA